MSRAVDLKAHVSRLAKNHGSLRKLANEIDVDYSYLSRLASGEKTEPSDDVLDKLNLRRITTYERK